MEVGGEGEAGRVIDERQLSSKNYTLNYALGSTQVKSITCIAEPRPFQRTVIKYCSYYCLLLKYLRLIHS